MCVTRNIILKIVQNKRERIKNFFIHAYCCHDTKAAMNKTSRKTRSISRELLRIYLSYGFSHFRCSMLESARQKRTDLDNIYTNRSVRLMSENCLNS